MAERAVESAEPPSAAGGHACRRPRIGLVHASRKRRLPPNARGGTDISRESPTDGGVSSFTILPSGPECRTGTPSASSRRQTWLTVWRGEIPARRANSSSPNADVA